MCDSVLFQETLSFGHGSRESGTAGSPLELPLASESSSRSIRPDPMMTNLEEDPEVSGLVAKRAVNLVVGLVQEVVADLVLVRSAKSTIEEVREREVPLSQMEPWEARPLRIIGEGRRAVGRESPEARDNHVSI